MQAPIYPIMVLFLKLSIEQLAWARATIKETSRQAARNVRIGDMGLPAAWKTVQFILTPPRTSLQRWSRYVVVSTVYRMDKRLGGSLALPT